MFFFGNLGFLTKTKLGEFFLLRAISIIGSCVMCNMFFELGLQIRYIFSKYILKSLKC